MWKCPYCGHNKRDMDVCEKCRARVPVEKPKEKPVKADKKTNKE